MPRPRAAAGSHNFAATTRPERPVRAELLGGARTRRRVSSLARLSSEEKRLDESGGARQPRAGARSWWRGREGR